MPIRRRSANARGRSDGARERVAAARIAALEAENARLRNALEASGLQLTIQAIANHMQSRLPSLSPMKNVKMHPEKAPRLYIATMMPSSALLGCPKVLRQSSLPTMPEKTP